MNMIKKAIEKYHRMPMQVKLTLWTFVCMCIQKGISIITVPIFTRMMSTEQYGQYSVYISWMNIFSIITSLRLYAGVYNKGLTKYKNDKNGFALSMQYTTTIITIVVYIIYIIFHQTINELTEMSTFVMTLMFLELLFTPSVSFWTVRQRYDFRYKPVVLATLFLAIINPAIGILAVKLSSDKGIARVVSYASVQIAFGSIFYVVNLVKGHYKFNRKYAKFAIKFNLPLIPHYFSEYVLNQSDRIMIQKLVGLSAAGVYSVAYSAGMLLTIVSSSINQALVPWLYQSLDARRFKDINKTIITLAFMILLPISMFMALSPEIVLILAGSQYYEAVKVMAPITGSIVFLFLYTLFANVEFYYDKNMFTMYISMIGAILNIILNFIFIKLLGFWAAGFTTFFCYGVYCLGHYLFMEHIFYKAEGQHLVDKKMVLIITVLLVVIMMTFYLLNGFAILRYLVLLALLFVVIINKNKFLTMYKDVLKKKDANE